MISAWLITSSAQLRPAALAQQRSAVQCRFLACDAVLCDALRCCAVVSTMHSSQQLSAVRCRALSCGAVSCCAVLSFEHKAVYQVYEAKYQVPGTKYQFAGTGMYVFLYSSFSFLQSRLSSLGPYVFFPRKLHPHCRSECDIANKHTVQCTQHRATTSSSAQAALGIINSLVAPNHGPLLSAPFTSMFWLHSSLRERSGRLTPPADRSTCQNYIYLLYSTRTSRS